MSTRRTHRSGRRRYSWLHNNTTSEPTVFGCLVNWGVRGQLLMTNRAHSLTSLRPIACYTVANEPCDPMLVPPRQLCVTVPKQACSRLYRPRIGVVRPHFHSFLRKGSQRRYNITKGSIQYQVLFALSTQEPTAESGAFFMN